MGGSTAGAAGHYQGLVYSGGRLLDYLDAVALPGASKARGVYLALLRHALNPGIGEGTHDDGTLGLDLALADVGQGGSVVGYTVYIVGKQYGHALHERGLVAIVAYGNRSVAPCELELGAQGGLGRGREDSRTQGKER